MRRDEVTTWSSYGVRDGVVTGTRVYEDNFSVGSSVDGSRGQTSQTEISISCSTTGPRLVGVF